MSNPALELADLLEGWAVTGKTPVVSRGGVRDGSAEFWRTQADAVSLLRDIDRAIDSLRAAGRPVDSVEASVASWHRAVFSYAIPWNSSGQTGSAIPVSDLNALRNFGLVLEMMSDVPTLSASQRSQLSEEVGRILDLLAEEVAGVSQAERDYVRTLANTMGGVLASDKRLDSAQLRQLADQLNGALLGVAAEAEAAGEKSVAKQIYQSVQKIVSVTRTVVYDGAAVGGIIAALPILKGAIESL